MCGSKGLLGGLASGLFGSDSAPAATPEPVREDPKAAADKATADAAQKTQTEKLAKRRRAVSLLATGGEGDTSQPTIGVPNAKSQLGQ